MKEIPKALSIFVIASAALLLAWYTVSSASKITHDVENSPIVHVEERPGMDGENSAEMMGGEMNGAAGTKEGGR